MVKYVCIGLPIPQWIHPDFALSNLPQIIAYTKKHLPDVEITMMNKGGVMTSSNRNYILKTCLENNIDAILWLDVDMIFPVDILVKFIQSDVDIVGSIYFKRSEPYDPVVYVKSTNPKKPYRIVDTHKLPYNQLVEVDGLGFGGMFVKTDVYRAMGEEKWMHYGKNFGIPVEMEDQLSHDLVFCQTAQHYGFKLYVHSGIKAGHIGEVLIEEKDWKQKEEVKYKKVAVLMPATDMEKAHKAGELLKMKAGYPCDIYIIEDRERTGYVATINDAVANIDAEYYVYTAQDVFPGQNWLKRAMSTAETEKCGLLSFNNGRWAGELAAFGMVERNWLKSVYGGNIFYPQYHSHYGDTELSVIAKDQKKYAYDPNAVLMEIEERTDKPCNVDDKQLYTQRMNTGFDGMVKDELVLRQFA